MSRISRKVRRIVAEVGAIPRRAVQPNMRLEDDLCLDRIDRIEIVVACEKATDARVAGEDDWRTVADIVAACRTAVMYGDVP
ncbi:acyl carrier protein [Komagataeibacter xylinus]|uniref:acyl carrier protein n=1 Tax=Komagataeibacter xylinus TaxID=28448 RepID=UPI00280A9FDF|nr:acyl carrier protein [Komagataeibacter xylinus]